MKAVIVKWGNSQAVRIPIKSLRAAGLSVNDAVDLSIEDGNIIIRRVGKSKIGTINLKELMAAWPTEEEEKK